MVADLIAALAQRGLPVQQESLLVSRRFLGIFTAGREMTNALRDCLEALEPKLALAPSVHARINSLATHELLVAINAPLEAQSFDIAPNRAFFGEYTLTSWKVRACNKAGCSAFTNIVTIE